MSAERSAALVRRWVGLYTRGLQADMRRNRRDEVDDDLWSQMEDTAASGRTGPSLSGEILLRLVLGVPADLGWRVEQGRLARTPIAPAWTPTTGTRGIGLLAMAGGLGWTLWPIPQAITGDAGWAGGGWTAWFLFVSVVLGTWALAVATIGLVISFEDKLRGPVAAVGAVGASVGALSVLGPFAAIVGLLVGSTAVMWELGRIQVLQGWTWRVHVAAAIGSMLVIVVVIVNLAPIQNAAVVIALLSLIMVYGASWIAVGWSLRRRAAVASPPA